MSGTSSTRIASGWRLVQIAYGDTLQSLALRHLGTAARWAELAALNDLIPPYISGDPAAITANAGRVLAYGGTIRVFAAIASADSATDPGEVFGTDIALTDGRLTVELGDYATATGLANFSAAVTRRVITGLGELPFHPEYGCGVRGVLGKVSGPTGAALAGRAVRQALELEDRIQNIGTITVTVTGDRTAIDATVTPIANAAVSTISTEV